MCVLEALVVGSLTGVGASFFVWWLTFKYWSPELKFGEKVIRESAMNNKSKVGYRFYFRNIGRRNIIDIEVVVQLKLKLAGFRTKYVYLPTSSSEYKKVAILKPGQELSLEILTHKCDYFQKSIFPLAIRGKSRRNELTLDEIMQLPKLEEPVTFLIMMIGTDVFSGTRKFFKSNTYAKNDIIGSY